MSPLCATVQGVVEQPSNQVLKSHIIIGWQEASSLNAMSLATNMHMYHAKGKKQKVKRGCEYLKPSGLWDRNGGF